LILEICFLTTQLKKVRWAVQEHSLKPAGSVLMSISSEVWRFIHIPAVGVSKEPYT